MDPKTVGKGQKPMQAPLKECGVTRFPHLKQDLINVSYLASFYCAITNMVEKVPSFKDGGAFWFTNLTTPDSFYVFPVLISLTCLIPAEAILCHWLTFYLFLTMYRMVLRQYAVETTSKLSSSPVEPLKS